MLNPRKAVANNKFTVEDSKNKNQLNYKTKVNDLVIACNNFESYLREKENEFEYSGVLKRFKNVFKSQLKKSKMLSRTSRILNKMSKELEKFKGKFAPEDLEKYSKAFDYKPEKVNEKDYIKRSAIDDKTVTECFKVNIPNILKLKVNEIKESKKSEKEEAKRKYLKELFKRSRLDINAEGDFAKLSIYKKTLKQVTIGNKVNEINEAAFEEFDKLEKVSLSENCHKIGAKSFKKCDKLVNIDLSKVKEIGSEAFSGCISLKKIDLSNITSEKTIGNGAFSSCSGLDSVILPKNSNNSQKTRARGIKSKIVDQVGKMYAKLIVFSNDPDKVKK